MDLRSLEDEVQRLIGYDWLVTSGVADRGPYLNFNARRRLLRIWLPRDGFQATRIAELAKAGFATPGAPSYQEVVYQPA